MSRESLLSVFDDKPLSLKRLARYQEEYRKRKAYIVFFTARSGSSYLADLLTKTGRAGRPGEYFNPVQMARAVTAMRSRARRPVESVVDYALNVLVTRSSPNGGFGWKATFAHYRPLVTTGLDRLLFPEYAPFYLYRNNIVNQAVSLHIMTKSTLAHATKPVSDELRAKADSVPYDAERIRHWVRHLWEQEKALAEFLPTLGKPVQRIEYQQLSAQPTKVVNAILRAIGADPVPQAGESAYTKVRSARNEALARQFLDDADNLRFLEDNGIPAKRLRGD